MSLAERLSQSSGIGAGLPCKIGSLLTGEQLSKEENASALISRLLNDYFRLNTSKIEEIESRQKQIEEERKKFNET